MKHKKQIYWISLALAFSLIAGLAFPASNVNAAKKTKEKNDQKVLVVYFSATGTTKGAAKKIKKATNGKLYQIKAADPYTDEDLSYDNDDCRANTEQKDGSIRPKMKGSVKNIQDYDVIFLGYPIWWGKEPMIIRTFLESHHVKGKKIVPFCTSGGSGISDSRKGIRAAAKGAKVVKGKDLTDASRKSVKSWALGKVK
ncbi:MAG: flavodoxin [Eubacterium sp.]|jgi:flavodoxin|nr:flavodoxin [Eubacterium sp.]